MCVKTHFIKLDAIIYTIVDETLKANRGKETPSFKTSNIFKLKLYYSLMLLKI